MIRRQTVLKCCQAIKKKCGLPANAIIIAASHSHSSGPIGMIQPGKFDHADKFVQELAYIKSSNADPKYVKQVEQAIINAVCEAYEKCSEAQCRA